MCVHRIPLPTSVTIASRPSLWVRDKREHRFDLPDNATPKKCDRLARRANQFVMRKLGVKSFLVIPGRAKARTRNLDAGNERKPISRFRVHRRWRCPGMTVE
jgi:hypothetical protein